MEIKPSNVSPTTGAGALKNRAAANSSNQEVNASTARLDQVEISGDAKELYGNSVTESKETKTDRAPISNPKIVNDDVPDDKLQKVKGRLNDGFYSSKAVFTKIASGLMKDMDIK